MLISVIDITYYSFMDFTENEFIKEISYFLKIKNENGYYPEVRNRFLDRNEHEHAYKEFENFIKRELKGV